jgi:hypothetical protein
MLKILVERYLPIVLAIIAGAGVTQSVGQWIGLTRAVLLTGAAGGMVITQANRERSRIRTCARRLTEAGDYIAAQIDEISTFEERLRGPLQDLTINDVATQVERWKEQVERRLAEILPETHVDVRFGKATGLILQGSAVFQHSRALVLREHLGAILDNLPSYVERSLA